MRVCYYESFDLTLLITSKKHDDTSVWLPNQQTYKSIKTKQRLQTDV